MMTGIEARSRWIRREATTDARQKRSATRSPTKDRGARRNRSLDPRTAGRRATTTYRLGPPAIIHGQARVAIPCNRRDFRFDDDACVPRAWRGRPWPARASWPQGPQRLRGQGRPAGPSRQRCAAALRPEGRTRTLRGAPGDERRRSRLPGFRPAGCPRSCCLPAAASQAAGEIITIAGCRRMVLYSSIQARHPGPGPGPGGEVLHRAQLKLQRGVERLDDGVVQGRAGPAHRLADPQPGAGSAEETRGVLAAWPVCKMTPVTWPPRTAAAIASAP